MSTDPSIIKFFRPIDIRKILTVLLKMLGRKFTTRHVGPTWPICRTDMLVRRVGKAQKAK